MQNFFPILIIRQKWHTNTRNVQVGDIVSFICVTKAEQGRLTQSLDYQVPSGTFVDALPKSRSFGQGKFLLSLMQLAP